MLSKSKGGYARPQARELARRLAERRRFLQVVAGPRQAGKTTLVRQVLGEATLAAVYASADEPTLRGRGWIEQQWESARLAAREADRRGAVLALDVLLLTRVDKPALLRRLFELACGYSGQELSYQKMLGQLQDAGNTTTLAHYLELLAAAGMVTGLQKFAGDRVRRRGSSPKLQVFNTALLTAQSGLTPREARTDPEFRGRLVESAVGAHLANAAAAGVCELFYWRDRNREVDFVVRSGRSVIAIEVKSGRRRDKLPGLEAFAAAFTPRRKLLVGGDGIPIEDLLTRPVEHWVGR